MIETLGERIREAREERGYGVPALAESLGVHRRTVERWESGEVQPSRAKVKVLALLLDKPLEWFDGRCACGSSDWIYSDPYDKPYPKGKAICGSCGRKEGEA